MYHKEAHQRTARYNHGPSRSFERIIESLARMRSSGRPVDISAIERTHPHLMPRLKNYVAASSIDRAVDFPTAPPISSRALPRYGPATDEHAFDVLSQRLHDYKLLERLGCGGQGTVYKAVQTLTDRIVALKILLHEPLTSRAAQIRFEREVKIIANLRHPNIVTLFESGTVLDRPYFAMEYVDGLPLDDYALWNNIGIRERVRLFARVCRAVAYAHAHGVVHRDLKPTNILVDDEREPHVVDFGLAKHLSTSQRAPRHRDHVSSFTHVVGTLPYLSPEQVCGLTDQVDARADIYALGVILFELLTDSHPYPVGGQVEQVRANILLREPPPLRRVIDEVGIWPATERKEVNDDVQAIVSMALKKDVTDRYDSANALADDLDRYLADEAVKARSAQRAYVFRKTVRRYRTHLIVATAFALVATAALAGTTVLWRRAEQHRLQAVRIASIAKRGLQLGAVYKTASVQRDVGRVDQAIALLESALDIQDLQDSRDPVLGRQMFNIYHQLGTFLYETEHLDGARVASERATAIANAMRRAHVDDAEWMRLSAFASVLRGRVKMGAQDWSGAHDCFEAALGIRRELAQRYPDNRSLRSELAHTHGLLGKTSRQMHRYDAAGRHYLQSYEQYHELARNDPDVLDHTIDLIRAENKLSIWFFHPFQSTEHDRVAFDLMGTAIRRLRSARTASAAPARERDLSLLEHDLEANIDMLARRYVGLAQRVVLEAIREQAAMTFDQVFSYRSGTPSGVPCRYQNRLF